MSKDAALTASLFNYVHRHTNIGRTVHLTDPTAQEPHVYTNSRPPINYLQRFILCVREEALFKTQVTVSKCL